MLIMIVEMCGEILIFDRCKLRARRRRILWVI
jgi:hypothetical protein